MAEHAVEPGPLDALHCVVAEPADLADVLSSLDEHERRVSGRKVTSPALVLRGSARIVAAVANCIASQETTCYDSVSHWAG